MAEFEILTWPQLKFWFDFVPYQEGKTVQVLGLITVVKIHRFQFLKCENFCFLCSCNFKLKADVSTHLSSMLYFTINVM